MTSMNLVETQQMQSAVGNGWNMSLLEQEMIWTQEVSCRSKSNTAGSTVSFSDRDDSASKQ